MWRVSNEPRRTMIVPLGDNKLVGIFVTAEKSAKAKVAIANCQPLRISSTQAAFKHHALLVR
jgi:hypothetical protein